MDERKIYKRAKELLDEMTRDRRYLHENAETGFDLPKTKAYIAQRLTEMGYQPQPCGRAGLTVIAGRGKGKAFLLRADVDGLPIAEKTGVRYACKTGNMHACGHDMHAAMLLGAARILKEREAELVRPVKMLFQPAEELLQGAKDCIDDGLLVSPSVGGAAALHVMTATHLPSGTIIVASEGSSAPAADHFHVRVRGKACHGATPHLGIDALTVAARIVVALQEISAREVSVASPAVLTVGKLQAGNAPNAIAENAEFWGTFRTYDEETRARVKRRIKEISEKIAEAFSAKAETRFPSGCPTLFNDGKLSKFAEATARSIFGEKCVFTTNELGGRGGGSEDFAYISRAVPSVMAFVCAGAKADGFSYPLHHEKADFDESVLPVGAAYLAGVALAGNVCP